MLVRSHIGNKRYDNNDDKLMMITTTAAGHLLTDLLQYSKFSAL